MSARDCKLALIGVDASKIPLLTPVERSHLPLGVDVDSGDDEPATTGAIVRSRPTRAIPLHDRAAGVDVDSGESDASKDAHHASSISSSSAISWNTSASNRCSVDVDSGSSSSSDGVMYPRSIGGMKLKQEEHKGKQLQWFPS